MSGWGAACFGLQGPGPTSVVYESYGFLGEGISNNIAEYQGLLAAVRHAAHRRHLRVCVQTDSKLVANQVSCLWACRKDELRHWLERVWHAMRLVESRGGEVLVEHIYREYNKEADALANRAVDERRSMEWRERT